MSFSIVYRSNPHTHNFSCSFFDVFCSYIAAGCRGGGISLQWEQQRKSEKVQNRSKTTRRKFKDKKQQKKKTDSGSGKAKGQGSLEGWLGKTVEANAGKKSLPLPRKRRKLMPVIVV